MDKGILTLFSTKLALDKKLKKCRHSVLRTRDTLPVMENTRSHGQQQLITNKNNREAITT